MRFAFVAGLIAFGLACGPSRPTPPSAEFLVAAGDSTLWVSSGSTGIHVRGSPVTLARYDGRFHDVFAVDDDRSYQDALIVGVRIYRRDVTSGDSLLVFEDSIIPRIADAYAAAHPDEDPLGDQDEVDENPSTEATSDVDLLDMIGPYLSYRFRADIDLPGRPGWHTARFGVIDLRTGKPATVADLFGDSAASRIIAEGRRGYTAMRDSVARVAGGQAARARRALATAAFDPTSFSLSADGRDPSVEFSVPLHGDTENDASLELASIPAPAPAWWARITPGLAEADGDRDRWHGRQYVVTADYDSAGETARLALVDSAKRVWPIGAVGAPIYHIDWLDAPPIDSAERRGVMRAFDAADAGDEESRVAQGSRATHGLGDSQAVYQAVTYRVQLARARHRRPRR